MKAKKDNKNAYIYNLQNTIKLCPILLIKISLLLSYRPVAILHMSQKHGVCVSKDNCGHDLAIKTTILTLPMLSLLSYKDTKIFLKPFKPCHVGIHRITLTEYSRMSTHVPGFLSFSCFFRAKFCLGQISHQLKGYLKSVPAHVA